MGLRWFVAWALLVPGVVGAQALSQALEALRGPLGLSAPLWDDALATTCRARAQALADQGLLTHQDPQGRGPGQQLLAQGFPPGVYGEVLGAGSRVTEVWAAWLASPPHRAVLSDPRWTRWAYGQASTGATTVWVVRFRGP